MEATPELAARLSRASVKKLWNVHTAFDWPEALDDSLWCMSPEMISIYGTEDYERLGEAQRRRLSFFEAVNLFSFVLHGERPLLEGVSHRLYQRSSAPEVNQYLHHFLDEENKHMIMFATFCNRYAGKIYPEKKIAIPNEDLAPGEEDIRFFLKVLVVEELGDVYNVAIARDERVHPIARELNKVHHRDEARHIVFGRSHLKDLFDAFAPQASQETLLGLRRWLGDYLRASWTDFYNVAVYRDAGLEDAYHVRQRALESPVCREHRRRVSSILVDYCVEAGILEEAIEF